MFAAITPARYASRTPIELMRHRDAYAAVIDELTSCTATADR